MLRVLIYTLANPLTKEIRYIGKTSKSLKQRLQGHIDEVRRNKEKSYKNNWIKSLLAQNLKPEIELLDYIESDDWEWLEQYWIAQFKEWGYSLVNMTDGGDGNKGQIFSEESNEKRRKALTGRPCSKETREKISNSHKGKIVKESTKRKLRKINLGKKQSLEVILKKSVIVQQLSSSGDVLDEFRSLSYAEKVTGISKGSISNVCLGRCKTAGGFKWKFK